MSEPSASQSFGNAHRVEAGLGRGAAYLANQRDGIVGEAAVLTVQLALIFQQLAMLLMTRHHFSTREGGQPIASLADILWQFESYRRHIEDGAPGRFSLRLHRPHPLLQIGSTSGADSALAAGRGSMALISHRAQINGSAYLSHARCAFVITSEEPYQAKIIKDFGLRGVIGKGGMGDKTLAACKDCGCVYLHAIGGAAQVLAECIKKVRNVYLMEKFGAPEAIWEFEVEDFPAVVTMDAHGQSLHKEVFARSQAELAKRL